MQFIKHYKTGDPKNMTNNKIKQGLKTDKNFYAKLAKYILLPATLTWVIIDIFLLVTANIYLQQDLYGPILNFTPIQTIIATIILSFVIYLVYKSIKKRRLNK